MAENDRTLSDRTLVVIPTLNESETIEQVVQIAFEASPDIEVLVVDDNSEDGTADLVDSMRQEHSALHLLRRRGPRGLGHAYREGLAWGLDRGFELLCELDGDLSHDPRDLPRLIGAAEEFDLVLGSRYVPGGGVQGWSRGRHWLSRAGNLYARVLLRLSVRDVTSGYRVYRRQALEAIALGSMTSGGYAFQIEGVHRVVRCGLTVGEVPITFTERVAGQSKMNRAVVLEAIGSVARWALFGPKSTSR